MKAKYENMEINVNKIEVILIERKVIKTKNIFKNNHSSKQNISILR